VINLAIVDVEGRYYSLKLTLDGLKS